MYSVASVTSSSDHLSVLDEVESVSSLDDGVNPGVEGGQGLGVSSDSLGSSLVGVEVGSLSEEVGSKSLVGVYKDSVVVVVVLGGDILDQKLDLPDEVSRCLGTLQGGTLSSFLVKRFYPFAFLSWLNSGNVELGSEGSVVSNISIRVSRVEEIVKGGVWKVSVLLVDLTDDSGVVPVGGLLVIRDLGSNRLSKLGGADESQDVGVVLQVEDLLLGGGLIKGGRSNSNNVVNLQVWELESEGEGEPEGSGSIS